MKKVLLIVSSVVLVAIAVVVGWYLAMGPRISPHVVPAEVYLQTPGNLEGNVYRLNARIVGQVTTTETNRLIMVLDDQSGLHLPVVVPYSFNTVFYPQQRYLLEVQVQNGLLLVSNLKKQ